MRVFGCRKKGMMVIGIFSFIILSFTFLSTADALNIIYSTSGASPEQVGAFEEAVLRWESILLDPITVNIDFSFASMGAGIVGSTSTSLWYANFSDIKDALISDQTSVGDAEAISYISSLPTAGSKLLWNSNNTYPGGTDRQYGAGWTWDMIGSSANLKALGYTDFTGDDATMQFNTNFAFDYDPTDGIDPDKMDFVGVATHELGHALGFISIVDLNASYNSPIYPPTILDIFRHSDEHGPGEIDISFDGRPAYFSHDFGSTMIDFSSGTHGPDGRQASHWADDLGLGIMDPTVAFGENLNISDNDALALDVIGWQLVPEPWSMFLYGVGLLGLLGLSRKKVKKEAYS